MDNRVNVEKYIVSSDSRLNYCFIKKDQLEDKVDLRPSLPEWLDKDLIDYDIVVKKEDDDDNFTCGMGKLDTTLPASYCAIKNVEDGIAWYREKHPELPEEFYEVIAKYTWGQEDKPDVKKAKKKRKNRVDKLKVSKGKFEVQFD
tara:strand:+ start:1210 stop:1644 length:435 start_codon:yes stop_codon:yes gene_type:complete